MSNTRTITAIVAFVATFIFSAGLVRIIFPAPVVKYVYTERPRMIERNTRSTNEIEQFLLRDINNGESRNDYRYADDYADEVLIYWQASSSMDFSLVLPLWPSLPRGLALKRSSPRHERS